MKKLNIYLLFSFYFLLTNSTLSAESIEVFVRHCHFSEVSQNKNRFSWFSREKCHENLLKTIDQEGVNITYFLDTHVPSDAPHFVKKQNKYKVIETDQGTESGAFLALINYITSLSLDPETIIYIVEDEYLHRPGWVKVLIEGFSLPEASYVSLYDHKDKYFFPMYRDLHSKLFQTKTCHWRTTPSTTNTFATRFKTLVSDLDTQRTYSLNCSVTADHEKFCALSKKGRVLISPIPGWSTHLEPEYASPCIDWEKIQEM